MPDSPLQIDIYYLLLTCPFILRCIYKGFVHNKECHFFSLIFFKKLYSQKTICSWTPVAHACNPRLRSGGSWLEASWGK
jgi:hypothetical protein